MSSWRSVLRSTLASLIFLIGTLSQDAPLAINFTSSCSGSCLQYGTCNEELARCDCPKNHTGDDCSVVADRDLLRKRCAQQLYPSIKDCVDYELACLNLCNRRGNCIAGWCHCNPGYFGADCSLSLGPDGKPVLLAGTNYTTRAKRPWVYVYELPPNLTTWQNTRRLDRSTHLHFYQRLLGSGARIADGDKADWYFIPIRQRSSTDSVNLRAALAYVRENFPWWNLTGGARHFVIHTGDLGADEVLPEVKVTMENATWLTHWGLTAPKEGSGWRVAHRPDKDLVIPVFLSPGLLKQFGLDRSPLHPLAEKIPRNTTFFFAGRICGDRRPPVDGVWPNCGPRSPGYSAGVRQLVHYHHWNRTGFRVELFEKEYGAMLRSSRFCLAPLGGGHGQRQIIVSYMGCIPVSIADNVYEPFEPQTNWSTFAVRPAEADIPRLHEILEGITPAELAAKQVELRCAAQHLLYSSIVGGLFGEDGRYDAFETTLEVLRVKAAHPDAPPDQYRALDPGFDAFMSCKDPPEWAVVGPVPDQYGLLGEGGGKEASPQKEGQGRVRGRGNPLCSNSYADRDRHHCDKFILGSSKTHGIPGGLMCVRKKYNLGNCPRIWL